MQIVSPAGEKPQSREFKYRRLSCGKYNNNRFTALCPGLPGWVGTRKKHSPTHHADHHPIFISFFHLLRSVASSLFKLRAWQSLHNLCPRPAVMQCSTFIVSKLCSCKLKDAQYRAHIPPPTYFTKWKFVWWLFATVLADKVMLSYILSR